MNSNLKILIASLSIVFIVYLVYYFYKRKNSPYHIKLVDKPIFMVENYNEEIENYLIPKSPEGQKYTFSFWIRFVNMGNSGTWRNYDSPKGIISHFNSPNVFYIPKEHILRILVGYKGTTEMTEKYTFDIENLKLQNWEHIAITIDGKNVSVFVNGEIFKSTVLPNTPFITEKSLFIGEKFNNFNGYLAKLEYWNTSLDIDQIKNLYKKNEGTLSNKLITYNEFYINKNFLS
jgi:hypothetical protein